MTRTILALCSCLVILQQGAAAQKAPKAPPSDHYEELLARYLDTARSEQPSGAADPGAWMNGLMGDLRARHVNDLVTVRVEESISASGSADSSLDKSSSNGIGITSLFGIENKLPGFINLGDLATGASDTGFKGAGTTTRAGVLTATLTARVVEVLPNGDLVIEGVREIGINGDRQIVVLTGVARVADVGPDNTLRSASIGQLRIRYFGRGLIKDSLSPGWLIRVLNKIF